MLLSHVMKHITPLRPTQFQCLGVIICCRTEYIHVCLDGSTAKKLGGWLRCVLGIGQESDGHMPRQVSTNRPTQLGICSDAHSSARWCNSRIGLAKEQVASLVSSLQVRIVIWRYQEWPSMKRVCLWLPIQTHLATSPSVFYSTDSTKEEAR